MSAQLVEEKTLSVKGAAQIENKFQETLETAFKSVKLKKEISEENHKSAAQFEILNEQPRPKGRGIRRVRVVYHHVVLCILCLGFDRNFLCFPHRRAARPWNQNIRRSKIPRPKADF
jgi:hypothetical protein